LQLKVTLVLGGAGFGLADAFTVMAAGGGAGRGLIVTLASAETPL
jgi:hypothetical protein